jgi:hypothetical protein
MFNLSLPFGNIYQYNLAYLNDNYSRMTNTFKNIALSLEMYNGYAKDIINHYSK